MSRLATPDHAVDRLRGSGVLLVGHGTRDALGSEEFFQLGRILQDELGQIPVEPSLLEFQQPSIPEAWNRLLARSPERIHVAPLLLFAAGHAKSDIPDVIKQCQSDHQPILVDQSQPLSRHRAIIELVLERLSEAVVRSQADPARTAVVMVGRGSYDPCAQADMRVLTELVRHRSPLSNFHTAFYAMAQPRLPDVLARVASNLQPHGDTIIVHPHLLFHGRLYQAIIKQTQQAAEQFPGIRFVNSDYLGPDRRIAKSIIDRVVQQVG